MKKNSAWLFLSMFAIAVACNDDDAPAANSITSDEAAVLISESIASEGLGMVTNTVTGFTTDLLSDNPGGRKASCGISDEFSINGESDQGAAVEYSYDFSYKYALACEGNKPSTLAYDLNYTGDFENADGSIDYSGAAKLNISGLQDADTIFSMVGSFKRSGTIVDKQQSKSLSCDVSLTLEDIFISKELLQISSGSSVYSISGSVPDKGSFKYTGTIEYLGSQQAEITVNGVIFTSDLKTGEVTKKK